MVARLSAVLWALGFAAWASCALAQQPAIPDVDAAITEIAERPPLQPGSYFLEAVSARELGRLNKGYVEQIAEQQGVGSRDGVTFWRISHGVADLHNLAAQLDALECSEQVCSLSAPLVIGQNAGLVIQGTAESPIELRLRREGGAMLANSGRLFVAHARIIGWDRDGPALAPGRYRPFIVGIEGSDMLIRNSQLAHLGYAASHAYGLNLTILRRDGDLLRPPPIGDFLHNRLTGLYYAFYSHGAEDVRIIGNVVRGSHKYGLDPHDDSKRLLIARNDVAGTGVVDTERGPPGGHGIIVSRGVTDSWIVQNRVIDNARSGIVIDKWSHRNLVADNVARGNKDDGITVFESDDLWITGNRVEMNGDSGIRVRHSRAVHMVDNIIGRHAGYCVKVTGGRAQSPGTGLTLERNACDPATRLLRLEDMEKLVLRAPAFLGHPPGTLPRARVNGPEPWRSRTLQALRANTDAVITSSDD